MSDSVMVMLACGWSAWPSALNWCSQLAIEMHPSAAAWLSCAPMLSIGLLIFVVYACLSAAPTDHLPDWAILCYTVYICAFSVHLQFSLVHSILIDRASKVISVCDPLPFIKLLFDPTSLGMSSVSFLLDPWLFYETVPGPWPTPALVRVPCTKIPASSPSLSDMFTLKTAPSILILICVVTFTS